MSKSFRILELDALRALAALAVLFFHYTYKYIEEFGHPKIDFSFKYGYFGVQLFFMISGFVIFMTVDKVKSSLSFFWLRFTRLFPTYWISILLTFTVVSIFGLAGREISWKAFLFNFTMLQEFFEIPHADGVYWSLLPELMFYCLMGVLISIKLTKHIHSVNLVWLSLVLLNHFIEFPELIVKIFNLKYGMLFVAGIEFYILKLRQTDHQKWLNILTLTLSWVVAMVIYGVLNHMIIITSFYLIFLLFTINKLGFLTLKPLVFLGTISYPLYLTHQNIGYIIMNYLQFNFWVEIILATTISIGLATAIHFSIEKPTLKYLRATIKLKR